jgi:hypothetical protein
MGGKKLLEQLRDYKTRISENLDVEKMLLFGSQASGKADSQSDVDLLVISSDFKKVRFIKRSIPLYRQWHLDYPVDILCYTPDEVKEKNKTSWGVVRQALKNGIVI